MSFASSPSLDFQYYLQTLYQSLSPISLTTPSNKNSIAETYGEILFPSVSTLIAMLSPHEKDIFLDLGSGLGKVVLQFYLQTPMQEMRGIEIISNLHQQAVQAGQKIQNDFPHPARKITFLDGDFLDIPFTDATILLLGSPCFTPRSLEKICKKIDATPTIHSVLSLKPLLTLNRLHFKHTLSVECTWDTALCYLYF